MGSIEHLVNDITAPAEALPAEALQAAQTATGNAASTLEAAGLPPRVTGPLRQAHERITTASQYITGAQANLAAYITDICTGTAAETPDGQPAEKQTIGHIEAAPLMASRRPAWLMRMIDEAYAELGDASKRYLYHGIQSDYDFGYGKVTDIITYYRRTARQGAGLRILDVGAGAGGFIGLNKWHSDDTVHGISGIDYRKKNPHAVCVLREDDPRYIVANAEHFDSVPGLLPEYDVIVSKLTIQHFLDGIGALEQIANRTAPGGLVCLDVNRGIKRFLPEQIAQMFKDNGFTPVFPGEDTGNRKRFLVMTRGEDARPVRFNVDYRRMHLLGYEEYLNEKLDDRLRRILSVNYTPYRGR